MLQQRLRAQNIAIRLDDREDQQPRDASVEPLGHAAVVTLRVAIAHARMHERIAEPPDQIAAVIQNVCVMADHHAFKTARMQAGDAHPDVRALSCEVTRQLRLLHACKRGRHLRTVVPKNARGLSAQRAATQLQRGLVLRGIHRIHAEDDLRDVRHLRRALQDLRQRRALALRVERRQQQRDRFLLRPRLQLRLTLRAVRVCEVVQRRDTCVLVKIGHRRRPL